MTDYILFGMQGSGKGTQGKFLAEKLDLSVFEMGARLRELASAESELANKVKTIIEAGDLVPDEIIIEIVEDFIDNLPAGKSILFDGIPRTMNQSNLLTDLLKSKERAYSAVQIKITEEEAMKRLTTRKICSQCKAVFPASYQDDNCDQCSGELMVRADDNAESIQKRLDNYIAETVPVINSFKEQENLLEVNGEQAIEDVTTELFTKFNL